MSAAASFIDKGYSAHASVTDCRVRERHLCGLQTSCQPIAARADKDCLWPAEVRDISVHGMGLVLRRRFERGTGLAVEIPGPDGQPADTLLAKVVHISARKDGGWLLGCNFVSELSQDELRRLLDLAAAQQAEAEDADIFSERPGTSKVEQLAEASGSMVVPRVRLEGPGGHGFELSRAVRRFFFKGTWPLQPGKVLRFRIFKEADEAPPVTVRVQQCVKGEKGWSIHYFFVGSPHPTALRLLGYGTPRK
jgi:hypothetical protein